MSKVVYTPGCWDLIHVGHLRYLQRASEFGTKLVVGVASDSVFELDKGMPPVINQNQRLEMIRGLQCVSEADIYFALDFTDHLQAYDPNAMVISSTWGSEKRHRDAERWCRARGTRIIKLAYDQEVSTTAIKAKVRARNEDQEWLG